MSRTGRNAPVGEHVRPVLAIAPRFKDLLQMSLTEQAELGFETSSSNGRPSATQPLLLFSNESSAEACPRADPALNRKQRSPEIGN
jgi:hypothetical protein